MMGFRNIFICFEASLHGLKKAGGLGGGGSPPHLQTQCVHDGFQKSFICFEASLHVGGGAAPPICKHNACMMGFKQSFICFEASLHGLKKAGGLGR